MFDVDHRGRTALLGAVERGQVEVVRMLLSRDARADTQDIAGETAAFLA